MLPAHTVVLVTGCCGYVGRRLVSTLVASQHIVWGTDVCAVPPALAPLLAGFEHINLAAPDVADRLLALLRASGATVVMHLASYGMSGREQTARPELVMAVNVGGTAAVVAACAACAASLVYVSTVNVCFGGREVVDGPDAPTDYAPDAQLVDAYSRSKARAERLARAGGAVALRLYGIYGEGEERHFPRMLRLMRWGLFVQFGRAADRSDWVHVDNVVHACCVAAARLCAGQCRGQAYFIGDNEPVNTIALCAPLAAMVGVPYWRALWVPHAVMYALGWATEWMCWAVHAATGVALEPLLTRAEVDKVARTHYWRTERARAELGYAPIVTRAEGLRRLYDYCAVLVHAQPPSRVRVHLPTAALLLGTLAMFVAQAVATFG